MWNCLERVVAVAGGCVVASSGVVDPGTLVGGAIGAAGLVAFWREGKSGYGPESSYRLGRIRDELLAELEGNPDWACVEPALRDAIDYRLGQALLKCRLDPDRLARSAVSAEGFPRAAASVWMGAVAELDPFFAESAASPEASPQARRFALLVVERALELAWRDRAYFAQLQPHLLKWIAQGVGQTREEVRGVAADVHRLHAASDEVLTEVKKAAADVKDLLVRFDATPLGARARRQIADSRPFVVLARRINQEVDDPDQALAELAGLVELVLDRQLEAARGTNLGSKVDAALRRIAAKAERGEFEGAAEEAASAFEDWEKGEEERRRTELEAGLRLIQANVEQNMLKRDAPAVVRWLERKAALLSDSARNATADWTSEEYEAWLETGQSQGISIAFEVAAGLARLGLSRSRAPSAKATWLQRAGRALQLLGEAAGQGPGTYLSIAAFRGALEQFELAEDPVGYATTLVELSHSLVLTNGQHPDQPSCEEAIESCREALRRLPLSEVKTRAKAENNMGNALLASFELSRRPWKLYEAIEMYKSALNGRDRGHDPLGWAATKHNLGRALTNAAELWGESPPAARAVATVLYEEGDVATDAGGMHLRPATEIRALALRKALFHFEAALEERTKGVARLGWASTQWMLAQALRNLGLLELSPDILARSVAAFEESHDEVSRISEAYAGTLALEIRLTRGWRSYLQRDLVELEQQIAMLGKERERRVFRDIEGLAKEGQYVADMLLHLRSVLLSGVITTRLV